MTFSLRDEHVSTQDVVVKSLTAKTNAKLTERVNEYLAGVDYQLLDIKWAASSSWLEALVIMRRHGELE